jgi:hypothetical protein
VFKKQARSVVAAAVATVFALGWTGAADAASGQLTVVTEPPNAAIWVNGQFIGQSPLQGRSLPVGPYAVRLVDQIRQISTTRNVEIVEDSLTILNVTLQSDYGQLSVDSRPQGADVYLLTKVGTTPVRDEPIIPGAYVLELRHPNKRYLAYNEKIIIEKGAKLPINAPLSRQGIMTVKSWVRIGLGVASLGGYLCGCINNGRGLHGDAAWEFAFGTVCLVGLEVVAFF